ncbi:MAG TPA: 1-(5-phosphoribosyl)-5-[(5-phosphoribosylamino)methylideneamino]imidazole-4-carboxamide isomerase [Deltaproteobacteria bacterium]|nr:1-(5-phosphoribosyl)-5-[(5-phosphoribosylamino)methylideneamino]imidazole-4-carboxamide isomerase [Deltaproteobacteria bacterium]
MIVIPAIDLHDGRVVRLKQGAFDAVTYYSTNPDEVARAFEEAGATRIHVVDLDGSLKGAGVNLQAIEAICKAVQCEVELGGGIRSAEDARRAYSLGVNYIILGTIVAKDPQAAKEILSEFPGKAGLGIDALNGRVAIGGWKEVTDRSAFDLAQEYVPFAPAFVVYTDISRDGMLSGPNIETTAAMVAAVDIPVIASGGVSSLGDLKALAEIPGLFGAITGKAVYEGRFTVQEAIDLLGGSE